MICFVAQPFRHPFQQRFDEVFAPAIKAAGLEAYKVDLDPAADKLIDDIESNIKRADVCLIDITEDNPNVWYELGYSQSLGKPLVMVSCSSERGDRPYPFDIRGRKVIGYTTAGPSDYKKLQEAITTRILALLEKAKSIEKIAEAPVALTEGIDPTNLTLLAIVVGECPLYGDTVTKWALIQELERQGLSKQGIGIAMRRALQQGFIKTSLVSDRHEEPYDVISLSAKGEAFVLEHAHLFNPTRDDSEPSGTRRGW